MSWCFHHQRTTKPFSFHRLHSHLIQKIECEIREKVHWSAVKLLFLHFFCSWNIGFPAMMFQSFFHYMKDCEFQLWDIIFEKIFFHFLHLKKNAWKARREYVVRSCFRQKPYCACINALIRQVLGDLLENVDSFTDRSFGLQLWLHSETHSFHLIPYPH